MPPAPTPPRVGQGRGGKGGRREGALPLRIVTSVRTMLDYVRGTGHRMEPCPLLDGSSCGQGELILVPPDCPSGDPSHRVPKAEAEESKDSDKYIL